MVTVRISGLCRSYADVPIGEDQELTLTVGREVTSIGSEGNIIVPYGNTHQVVISAQSAQAAAYRQVTISSLSPDIASLETNRVTLDAEGRAYITVIGRLPGTTYLQYSVKVRRSAAWTLSVWLVISMSFPLQKPASSAAHTSAKVLR